MPRVFLPPAMRSAVGVDVVEIDAENVRAVVAELDLRFPGIGERLCDGDELKPGLTVSVDGRITPLGMLQKVGPEAEVHFLPAIGGG